MTLIFHHNSFRNHLTSPGHPEAPGRMDAIENRLKGDDAFKDLEWEEATEGDIDVVSSVHPQEHIDGIRELIPETGTASIDGDTMVSPGSWQAAMLGIGAVCLAVDAVSDQQTKNAFCIIRPPGHHAETDKAMGFCLFANGAVAARYAKSMHSMEKVAIVDFDVHHGNGYQDVFWNDPSVMYCSTHQEHIFPFTGFKHETGNHGNIVNAPLRENNGSVEFREAMIDEVLPKLKAFAPDMIIIAAGFDAHGMDPLASINLDDNDFAWVTEHLMEIADDRCDGRLVSILEGGYNLESLASSAAAHVKTLMTG